MPLQGEGSYSNPQHWADLPNAGGMQALQAVCLASNWNFFTL